MSTATRPILVHIDFPHAGPWGAALADACAGLARSIATEPGLRWKAWLEDEAAGRAGGAYLFDSREAAERYLAMHRERLAQWGITGLRVVISEVNLPLSGITGLPLPGTAVAA
ncbi:YdhR family protein [Caldimonas tepidiphila]|uniref:YdhR family protein n=1 Tax=Caldimonas tepidiphila TaxID=2315841 RepID=UPI000E5B4493|nr:YdhR family protein [Caldimonas tepidiphila]